MNRNNTPRAGFVRAAMWTLWAVVPVAFAAYHFGPGQSVLAQSKAAELLEKARTQTEIAQTAQDRAYEAHLQVVALRDKVRSQPRALGQEPSLEDKAALAKTTEAERAAYAEASQQWRTLSETLAAAESVLREKGLEQASPVRIEKARAMIRAGLVNSGIEELESEISQLEEQRSPTDAGGDDSQLLLRAREELGTGYYYNARLKRLAGENAEVWRDEAARARQQYRFLAESLGDSAADRARASQENVERVLNLEQTSLDDLVARPKPRNSPEGRCEGDKPGTRKGKRPGKRPGEGDARGAGRPEEMGPGW